MQRKIATLCMLAAMCMAFNAFTCKSTPDQAARDVISSSNGVLVQAQAEYVATCKPNPSQRLCVLINQAGFAQNASITALETYCGFQLTPILPDPSTVCVPQKNAQAALLTTVTNLKQLTGEIQAAMSADKATTAKPPGGQNLI
jgi:hypothetical protein